MIRSLPRALLPAFLLLPCVCGCKVEVSPAVHASSEEGGDDPNEWVDEPDEIRNPADFGFQRTVGETLLEEGRLAYTRYCSGCHGPEGDGQGTAARFLNPPPRDFIRAKYKFRSTRFGKFPSDEDLFRTITSGLRGTAMPSWRFLPEQTRWALVAYLKDLGWERRLSGPAPSIPFVGDPYLRDEDKSRAIQRGEKVYHGYFSCWHCHPAYVTEDRLKSSLEELSGRAPSFFRDDVHRAAPKETDDGLVNYPPDFRRDWVKSGLTVTDLYRVIGAGITGTAMPTWVDAVESLAPDPENGLPVGRTDLWAMAYYIQDMVRNRDVRIPLDGIEVRDGRKMLLTEEGAHYEITLDGTEEED